MITRLDSISGVIISVLASIGNFVFEGNNFKIGNQIYFKIVG